MWKLLETLGAAARREFNKQKQQTQHVRKLFDPCCCDDRCEFVESLATSRQTNKISGECVVKFLCPLRKSSWKSFLWLQSAEIVLTTSTSFPKFLQRFPTGFLQWRSIRLATEFAK
jgi:hypothetical protein